MGQQLKGDLGMLTATMFWGSSYLFMKLGLIDLRPFDLIFLRFGVAFVVAGTVFHRRIGRIDARTLGQGAILGGILFGVFAAVTYGVQYTSAPHAGFLVSLAVVFVPVLSAVVARRALPWAVWVAVGLAVSGVVLLTLHRHYSMGLGDALCIVTAFMYAAHIVVTHLFADRADPIALGTVQLGVAALLGLGCSLLNGTARVPNTGSAWTAVLALGVLCSAFGFIVQTASQRYTSPTHTGLIFSLEPVFAVLFSYLLFGQSLSLAGFAGAGLILAGVVFAEIVPRLQDAQPLPNSPDRSEGISTSP